MNRVADDSREVFELMVHRRRTGEPASSGECLGKLTMFAEALKSPDATQKLRDALTGMVRDGGRG